MGKRSSLWSVVIENCNSLWDVSTSPPLVLVDLRKAHLFVQHDLEDPGGRNEPNTLDFGAREHAAIIFLEVMLFVWPLVLGILLAHSTFSSVLVKINI